MRMHWGHQRHFAHYLGPTSTTVKHIIPLLTKSKHLNAAHVCLINYQGSKKMLLTLCVPRATWHVSNVCHIYVTQMSIAQDIYHACVMRMDIPRGRMAHQRYMQSNWHYRFGRNGLPLACWLTCPHNAVHFAPAYLHCTRARAGLSSCICAAVT